MKKKELDTETAQQALPIKKRLLSLDALRGITVAGMILGFSFLSVHHGYFNIYFIKQIQFQRFPTSGNQDIETHISYSMHRMGNRLV